MPTLAEALCGVAARIASADACRSRVRSCSADCNVRDCLSSSDLPRRNVICPILSVKQCIFSKAPPISRTLHASSRCFTHHPHPPTYSAITYTPPSFVTTRSSLTLQPSHPTSSCTTHTTTSLHTYTKQHQPLIGPRLHTSPTPPHTPGGDR